MNKETLHAVTMCMLRVTFGLVLFGSLRVLAYETYSDPATGTGNCYACHGDFRGGTSTKGTVFPGNNHDMHRTTMGTACSLCHTGSDRSVVFTGSSDGTANNTGLGCIGCHSAPGLRKHHQVNGVSCSGCHPADPAPGPETVKPPYYGTADTKVRNPGNTVLIANTNENWSIGDFLGLDNDGNNLYDLADYAVGPFKILSLERESQNVRISFVTAGGGPMWCKWPPVSRGHSTISAGPAYRFRVLGWLRTNICISTVRRTAVLSIG